MVEHTGQTAVTVQLGDSRQLGGAGVPLHMPAPSAQARRECAETRPRCRALTDRRYEIESHTTHAQGMHRVQFDVGDVVVDNRNAPVATGIDRECTQHERVVRAVYAGLYKYEMPDSMGSTDRLDLGQPPIDRPVVPAVRSQ